MGTATGGRRAWALGPARRATSASWEPGYLAALEAGVDGRALALAPGRFARGAGAERARARAWAWACVLCSRALALRART
jgi:hypothetical protein